MKMAKIILGCILMLCAVACGQENSKSVIVIPITFKNNEWRANLDKIVILPCEPPSLPTKGAAKDPLVQLLGRGKTLFQYHFKDPRIFLPEDYKEEYALMDKVNFTLRLPLVRGIDSFQFFYKPEEQKDKPTLAIDLKKYIEDYNRKGGEKQKAPCQEEPFVPDQRRKR